MFPKIEDWGAFVKRVERVCGEIREALSIPNGSKCLLTMDEKTGIQALERSQAPMKKKQGKLQESSYTRHGTTTLIAAQNVGTGEVIQALITPTRTEQDFLLVVKGTLQVASRSKEYVILADQLNTHKSASLVKFIAKKIGFKGDLGKKGRYGILKNMKSRQAFLEDSSHRIRFLYTPKHCSWLNPIENWFSKLQRHIISGASFSSVEELEKTIKDYIYYYIKCLTKPMNWKFEGFKKGKKLENYIIHKT